MTSSLEAAQAELDMAGIRRADIDLEMAKQQKILDDLAERKNKGRGRPSTTHASKVRAAVCCVECGRPRLIYSMKKPLQKVLTALDAYKEDIDYQCGDCLFDAEEVAEGNAALKVLAEEFHVKQTLTCRDAVEPSYFNFTNVAGRVDLEWVCSLCGAGPDESPLDPATCGSGDVSGCSGFAMSMGKMVLPMCICCRRDPKNKLVVVGTTNQVEKERERQAAKQAARKVRDAKKRKGAAAAPSSEDEADEAAAEEEAAQASGGSGGSSSGGGSSGISLPGPAPPSE